MWFLFLNLFILNLLFFKNSISLLKSTAQMVWLSTNATQYDRHMYVISVM